MNLGPDHVSGRKHESASATSKDLSCMLPGGGGGNLCFQDTGLCHSNGKSTTHKSGEISQKYTHKSGEFLKIIPINPGMPKKLTNN